MTAIPGLSGAVRFLKLSCQVMIRVPTLTGDLRQNFYVVFLKYSFLFCDHHRC